MALGSSPPQGYDGFELYAVAFDPDGGLEYLALTPIMMEKSRAMALMFLIKIVASWRQH